MDMSLNYNPPTMKKSEPQQNPDAPDQAGIPAIPDYMLIAEQNLFHPERRIPEKKEEKQLPKPEFVLYGTLITDDTGIAYMEDLKAPYNTAGRGNRQKAIQKGSIFSGFSLSEIHHDKVVMLRGDERIDVKITEQKNKKPRIAALPATGDVKSEALEQPEVRNATQQPSRGRAEVRTSTPRPDRIRETEQQRSDRRNLRRNPNPQ